MTRVLILGAVLTALTALPAAAQDRRVDIAPYIELGQVLTDDFTTGDVLTYSTVAAGVDASVQTRRAQVRLSYRYERRIAWDKRVGDADVHSGLARGAVQVAPALTIEAGALATRARSDIRGAAPVVLAGNTDNISQVYSGYIGPTLVTNAGPVAIAASYRYGYTRADVPSYANGAPAGQRLDVFGDAQSHVVQASAGTKAGTVLPIGVTVSGDYDREEASQLAQRYEGYFGRVDAVAPVLRTVALLGGVGYEKITISQKDALIDAAGVPVVDRNGRFQTDPASPRRIAYRTDGLLYDAGVVWRPSPRTTVQALVGRRYGGMTYTGSLSYAASRSVGVQLQVYDSVETFAHQLRDGIASLPTSFVDQRDAFGQQFSGCTFGAPASNGAQTSAGGCLNGVFQSIASASYRARGVDAVVSANHGPLRYGIGAGYANRRFYAPGGTGYTVNGLSDESYYAQAFAAYELDRVSGVQGTLLGNYYESGIAETPGIYSVGATGLYYHNFGRLSTSAALGVYSFGQQGIEDQVSGTAQLGMRYQF